MKKLFVLLLALVVVGGAFAQLTVTGYDKALGTYNSDAKAIGYSDEIRINFDGKDADGNYGYSARLQGSSAQSLTTVVADPDGTPNSGDELSLSTAKSDFKIIYAYGWAKFFDGKVKFSAGRLNDSTYDWGQNEANSQMGNVAAGVTSGFHNYRNQAFLVQAMPMDGLNVGFFYQPDGETTAGSNAGYGLTYSVEKLLNIKTAWKFDSDKKANGHLGVEYVGVENLSAVAGFKMLNSLDTTSADGGSAFGAYSIVGYTMDKVFFEAAFDSILKDAGDNYTKWYYVEGNVEYTDTAYSVRGYFGYQKLDEYSIAHQVTAGNDDYGIGASDTDVNKYKVGVELAFPVGGGELAVGGFYADQTKFSLPVYLKIAF